MEKRNNCFLFKVTLFCSEKFTFPVEISDFIFSGRFRIEMLDFVPVYPGLVYKKMNEYSNHVCVNIYF